ncbi:MAG: hypothetical protein CM15mV2_3080 [uncultured marine virus]|nr:MAG: hypothetical protein CM15mV2_3080 [uncultured marine virus]
MRYKVQPDPVDEDLQMTLDLVRALRCLVILRFTVQLEGRMSNV